MSIIMLEDGNTAMLVMVADGSINIRATVTVADDDTTAVKTITLTTGTAEFAIDWSSSAVQGRRFSIKPKGGGLFVRLDGSAATGADAANEIELDDGEPWAEVAPFTKISIKRRDAVSTTVIFYAGGLADV